MVIDTVVLVVMDGVVVLFVIMNGVMGLLLLLYKGL